MQTRDLQRGSEHTDGQLDGQPGRAPVGTPTPPVPLPGAGVLSWIEAAVQITGVAILGLAGFTLVGWLYLGGALLQVNPVIAKMQGDTALCLLFAALALLSLSPHKPRPGAIRFARVATAGAGLVALATLLANALGLEPRVERWLAWVPVAAVAPGALPMGVNTAVALLCCSGALFWTRRPTRRVELAQAWAVGAIIVALFTLLGYAYGLAELERWFSTAGMAPQTAFAIVLLGLAILGCEPERGLVAPLLRRGASGHTVRRLLPAAFLALIALGAISVAIAQSRLFAAEMVVASFALASFVLIAVLVYWNAAALARLEQLRAGAEAEREEANARLAASEERFRLASKALRGWIYDSDLAARTVTRSEGFFSTLGFDPITTPATVAWWLSRIHPDDVEECERRAHAALTGSAESITQEYRVRAEDGRILWVWDHTIIARDAAGRPLRMIGNVLDITARKAAEAAVRESEERFRNMADHSPGMVWLSDVGGAFTFLSQSWYTLTGQTPATALGFGWLDAVHPDELEVTHGILNAATSRRIPYRFDFRVLDRDDAVRWVFLAATPRFGSGREFLGYVGSMIDITDRKSMEEELREADQRKDEFLAMLGHELRNPLAPIRSAAAVMRYMSVDDPKFLWVREVLERQVTHMTRLIDDLLDVARITRGTVQLRLERVELARLVRDAVELSRPLIEDRGHRLEVTLPPEAVWLDADPARLEQVLANLLNNAAKYTEQEGRIDLLAALRGTEVEIRVTDTGVGIDAELLPRVFDLFTQDKQSIDRSQGGLGIGLTLVKALVELHGGLVEVHSGGRGQGAQFVVRLPVAGLGSGAAPALRAPDRPPPSAPRRVLIVDDNRDSADGLATLLSMQGHHVATAHDGPTALDKAHRFLPDVVLLDLGLPGMDGYEVARRMRASPDLQASRLVAVTGYGGEADRQRSREAGFSDHLVKPVDAEALHGLLNSLEAA